MAASATHAPSQTSRSTSGPVSAPVAAPAPRAAESAPRASTVSTRPPAISLASSTPASPIGSSHGFSGGGQPLAPAVQGNIERSLNVDLQSVRVHTDSYAHTAANTFSARAFTYGTHIFLGAGERSTDLGLMAHESAHVVQQQGATVVQRWATGQSDKYESEAHRASAAV